MIFMRIAGYAVGLQFRLRNDLYCVGWGVKLYSLTHSLSAYSNEILVGLTIHFTQSIPQLVGQLPHLPITLRRSCIATNAPWFLPAQIRAIYIIYLLTNRNSNISY